MHGDMSMYHIALLLVMTCITSPEDKALLERLVQNHRAARESITSLHCSITQTASDPMSPFTLQATFWKNLQGHRISVIRSPDTKFHERTSDTSFNASTAMQLLNRKRGAGMETVLIKYTRPTRHVFGDPYFFGLMTFTGATDLGPYFLEDLLENKAISVSSVESDKSAGHEVIRLKLTHKLGYFLLTFDEKVNYLATSAVYSINNDKLRSIN